MGNSPQGKSNYFIELLLAINRLTQVLLSPLANRIDMGVWWRGGPYGNSRYTWCGTVGKYFYRQCGGKVMTCFPVAYFVQRITEKGWLLWWRDKHHTLEAYDHESEEDRGPV